jgi:hypothetical protein
MPRYYIPQTDVSRLSFLAKTVATANAAIASGTTQRIPAELLAEVTAHHDAYAAAHNAVQIALSQRVGETAEAKAAADRLYMYISHMWTTVYNRYLREEQSPTILGYYRLQNEGSRPSITRRQEILMMAAELISGDAQAVADGYAPISQPTALELQGVLAAASTETDDSPTADARYDEAQAAVAVLRPEADRLIKEVRDYVLFSARTMDASSQRRILRNFGAVYYYSSSETIDEGDDTAVVTEEGAGEEEGGV